MTSLSARCTNEGNAFGGPENENSQVIQNRELLHRLVSEPEKFIDKLFAEITNHGEEMRTDWVHRLTKQVHAVFSEADVRDLYKIPSLNIMTLKEMENMDGKVVRFRGMVQELYDPVLTQSRTTIKNLASGESRDKCLLFMDKLHLDNSQKQIDVSGNLGLHEIELMHFVSVPGENKWVRQVDEAYVEKCTTISGNSINVDDESVGCSTVVESDSNISSIGLPVEKKGAMFGFPLPTMLNDPHCKAVIGKIYRHPEYDVVMNDVLDLYGILMMDQDELINSEAEFENRDNDNGEESVVRNPPSSIIPRMTVLGYSKQCSFELPRISLTVQQFDQFCTLGDWRHPTRIDLMNLLGECLSGDTLAARYVLMNLLSRVNSRMGGGSPMGCFPICITGIPLDSARLLNTVIQNITPKSVYLENFLDGVENDCYIPWKDYGCDKFMGGILQLSEGTHLILEERDISEQHHRNLLANQKALQNLTALQKLIEWQTVGYDFKYQQMEFLHDVPVLILSTSRKTLFSNIVQIPFRPDQSPEFCESHLKPRILEILGTKNNSKMSLLRDFLSHTKKNIPVLSISPAMQEIIGSDFSELRKSGEMDAEDLSLCLTHSRYWLNYEGSTEFTEDIWKDVLKAEKARKLRLISTRNSQ